MMIALIISGQLIAGVVIDHFGILGVTARHFDITRVIGVAALLFGSYLIAK